MIKRNFPKLKHSWSFSPTQVILLGFLGVILVGTLLLCLPFATSDGQPAPFIDALFTATTSVCVTGLVTVETAGYWSLFGHVVILLLIQCGGLGIISFTTATLLILRKKITLRNRILLEEAFNLNNLSGLLRFLQKVFKGTFIIEGIGVVFSAVVFVPEYGPKGIWYALFHSVSAFCNAGLDLLGADSLIAYDSNVLLNVTTMLLIVTGGLGFPVWWNLIDSIKYMVKEKKSIKNGLRRLHLHSKIVLCFTAGLILTGAVFIFLLEKDNPGTLGGRPLPKQILMSFFQSVTLRTAGFCTIPQQNLTDAGALISMLFMFVGGSPIGTAGGIKTTTAAVLVLSVVSLIRGRQETTVFGRTISAETVRKALGVATISIAAVGMALFAMLIFEEGSFVDLTYEVISATATVGLSRNITPGLGNAGKLIIILCMYLGRIGPISLAIALGKKRDQRGRCSFPTEEVPVG
ncbi:MAG: TrkH family potassium uptake protein [Lachnospiraceae bacterium]